MKFIFQLFNRLMDPLRYFSNLVLSPLLDLSFRLYLGYAFFKTGLGRAKDYFNGSWDTQLFLFEHEHPVPFLEADLAAPITTMAELFLPVFVVLGLFARFGAAGLLTMALVIDLTYQHHIQHVFWMALAASIFLKGPGSISIDHWIVNKYLKNK